MSLNNAAEAPAGLEFGGFIVNGQRIDGNSFVYESGKLHRAEACYRNPATDPLMSSITAPGTANAASSALAVSFSVPA